jgi:Bacterial regulatory protein, Fis family
MTASVGPGGHASVSGLVQVGRSVLYAFAMLAAHAWVARLLTRYGPPLQAQALSVWSCAHGRLDLVCDWLGNQRLTNLLHTHWPTLVLELRAGRSAQLAPGIWVLPVQSPGDRLLGTLVFAGLLPSVGGRRALVDDLVMQLIGALGAPLPPPQPEVLTLPLAQLEVEGGPAEAERRFYAAVLERHGGNAAQAGRMLRMPRETLRKRLGRLGVRATSVRLLRTVPVLPSLEPEARELEREACQRVLQGCRGEVRLGAAVMRMTPAAWRAYLRALDLEIPATPRRPIRRRSS